MEIWKDISCFENYQVSSDGRVRSIRKILRPVLNRHTGYYKVNLYNPKQCTRSVHSLVAKEFLGNPEGLQQVNHIDGNKANNAAKNLEWCDQSHNMKESYRLGLHSKEGTKNSKAKLSIQSVSNIRRLYEDGIYNQPELAQIYGVAPNTICGIINYITWKIAG